MRKFFFFLGGGGGGGGGVGSAGPIYRQGRLLPRAPLYSGLLFEIIKYYIYL